MKNSRIILLILFLLAISNAGKIQAQQELDSTMIKLTSFVEKANLFSQFVPQEKVYLHLDNTDYFLGENIWFKAYVTTSELNKPSELSKVLYVDILSPEGTVVITKKYHIENGQCHGDLYLDRKVFYSGFHEIRAYTRYMTNFDSESVYSRVVPVYQSPEKTGNYDDRKIADSQTNRSNRRLKSEKKEDIEVSFFPQGGSLITGLESRVAFKATDKNGRPIEVSGVVLNRSKDTVAVFSSIHQGVGEFRYTPEKNRGQVEIKVGNKKKSLYMPESLPAGYVINVNSLQEERLTIQLQKSENLQGETIGIATMMRGKVYDFSCIDFSANDVAVLNVDKSALPAGVGQIIVFDANGKIWVDRMFFVKKDDSELSITTQSDKKSYKPYEKVNLDFLVKDKTGSPVKTKFSLSVKDGDRSYENAIKDNLLINMLLSSDLKGYIENPSYYFEANDRKRLYELDLLMMTQGWRRYKWEQMSGIEPMKATQMIEKCLVVDGNVRSRMRKNPKAGMDMTIMLSPKDSVRNKVTVIGNCVTGKDGEFTFYVDDLMYGKWNAVIQAQDKGKNKDNRIMLNSLFKPEPRAYTFYDTVMKKRVSAKENGVMEEKQKDMEKEEDVVATLTAENDSILDMSQRQHILQVVSITDKRDAQKTNEYLTSRTIEYDVMEERDRMIDEGDEVYDNVVEFMSKTDPFFRVFNGAKVERQDSGKISLKPYEYSDPNGYYTYRNRPVMFMLNNKPIVMQAWKSADDISMSRINKIAIYEAGVSPRAKYDEYGNLIEGGIDLTSEVKNAEAPPAGSNRFSLAQDFSGFGTRGNSNPNPSGFDLSGKAFSNNIYIFLYSNGEYKSVSQSKGIRVTTIDGYAISKEFYSPMYDYELDVGEIDIRRTLYWNPNVEADENGEANVNFYNNNSAQYFIIDAETITADGKIGSLSQ